jgi:3-hydroxyacyl-CoA dehydrogenase
MKVGETKNIAVTGFGTMVRHFTQLSAQSGYSIVARDISKEALKFGLEDIRKGRFGLERRRNDPL